MTIKEYLQRISKTGVQPMEAGASDIVETLMENTDIWSGSAAMGYAAAAATATGLTHDQITRLLDAMNAAQENMTVDEAAAHYESGTY